MKYQEPVSKEVAQSSMCLWLQSSRFYDHKICAAVVSLLATGTGFWATPYMGLATLSYGFMNIGLMNLRNRDVHVRYMNAAIVLDLALVLALEFQRDAIQTALSFSLSPLQQAHIAMSAVATTLYIPILILGWRLYLGKLSSSGRSWHRRLGMMGYVFRSLGFLLMFSLLLRK